MKKKYFPFLYHFTSSQLSDVQSTKEGVKCSIATAKQEVEETFQEVHDEVMKALDVRRHGILNAINEVAKKDLEPLKNLEDKISEELNKVHSLVEKGKFVSFPFSSVS